MIIEKYAALVLLYSSAGLASGLGVAALNANRRGSDVAGYGWYLLAGIFAVSYFVYGVSQLNEPIPLFAYLPLIGAWFGGKKVGDSLFPVPEGPVVSFVVGLMLIGPAIYHLAL